MESWFDSSPYSAYAATARDLRAASDQPIRRGPPPAPAPPVMRAADARDPSVLPITQGDVARDRFQRSAAGKTVKGARVAGEMVVRGLSVPVDVAMSIPEVARDIGEGNWLGAAATSVLAGLPFFFGGTKRVNEFITGPALRVGGKTYSTPHGTAHIHVLRQVEDDLVSAARARGVPERHVYDDYYAALKRASSDDEGFIVGTFDEEGNLLRSRFVNREDGWKVAEENGQLIPGRRERLRERPEDLHAGDLRPPPTPRAAPRDDETARALFDSVKEPDSGITLDPVTRKPTAQSGYAVADPAFTVPFNASDPRAQDMIREWLTRPEVAERLRAPGAHIGAWHNPKTGELEVNISDLIADESAARQLGIERKQHGIGHLIDGQYQGTIDLDPPGAHAGGIPDAPPPAPAPAPATSRPPRTPEELDALYDQYTRQPGASADYMVPDVADPSRSVLRVEGPQQRADLVGKGPYQNGLMYEIPGGYSSVGNQPTFGRDFPEGWFFGFKNRRALDRWWLPETQAALADRGFLPREYRVYPRRPGALVRGPTVKEGAGGQVIFNPYRAHREVLGGTEEELLRREAERAAEGAAQLDAAEAARLSAEPPPPAPRPVARVTLDDVLPFLTEQERARVLKHKGLRSDVLRYARKLGPDDPLVAAALRGQLARGGYASVLPAAREVFGDDADRFLAIWAAVSPRQLNENAIPMAQKILTEWRGAGGGGPISTARATAIARRSAQLPARVPNVVEALTRADPRDIVLSGPKVGSFLPNLRGVTDRVTLDALQGAGMGIDPEGWNALGRYLTGSAQVRRVADRLTRETGAPWSPSEAQETMWSTIRALMNLPGAERAARGGYLPELVESVTPGTAGRQWGPGMFGDIVRGSAPTPPTRAPAFPTGDPAALEELARTVQRSMLGRYLFGLGGLGLGGLLEAEALEPRRPELP